MEAELTMDWIIQGLTSWTPWAHRSRVATGDWTGLYVIGRFGTCPSEGVDPLAEEVV